VAPGATFSFNQYDGQPARRREFVEAARIINRPELRPRLGAGPSAVPRRGPLFNAAYLGGPAESTAGARTHAL